MRTLLLAAAFAAISSAAHAETWISVCFGQDVQYTQSVDGTGYFHVANGDGTYDTQKLVQSFHKGDVLCAVPDPKAPRSQADVAEVCADKAKKTISVLQQGDKAVPVTPANAKELCSASINVY